MSVSSIQKDFEVFISAFQTLQLASVSPEGIPDASYAPFVLIDGCWYIYISELARHTNNILSSSDVSVLLIEPEQQASHLFARKRVTLQMRAKEVSRETRLWFQVLDCFEAKFGEIISMLRQMTDFHLIAMNPTAGTFVRGFAQAYRLSGEYCLTVDRIRDRGHKIKSE